MESINPVLKSLTPKSRVEKDNDVYSTVIEPSSSFSSTWSSLLGVNYGSMSVELENRIRANSEGMANPSGANFNALASQDEEVQSIMNDPQHKDIRSDLAFALDKTHLLAIRDEKFKRIQQHKIIENSSLGTYTLAILADPINIGTIVFPVLRSASVYNAMRNGAIMAGGIVAPLEYGKVQADPLVQPLEGIATTGASMLFSSVLSGVGYGLTDWATTLARRVIHNDVTSQMVSTGKFPDSAVFRDGQTGQLVGDVMESVKILPRSGKSIFEMSGDEMSNVFKGFNFNKIITNQKEVEAFIRSRGQNPDFILGMFAESTNKNVYINFPAIRKQFTKLKSKTKNKAAREQYKSYLDKRLADGTMSRTIYNHHMNMIKHINLLNNHDEFAKFILLHELHHTTNFRRTLGNAWEEPVAQYEARIDEMALNFLRNERSVTEYSIFKDGVKTPIDPNDIPVLHNPNSFDTRGSGAFLNTWAYKAITTPFKRFMMAEKIDNNIKGYMEELGGDMGIKLQKNALGIPSKFSVHIKSNTDHGKWARAYDDVMTIYGEDTKKKVTTAVDYRIWGARSFDDWMKNVNRRMVFRDFEGATAGEMKAVRIFEKFWKEWEDRLLKVNMIGSKKGMITEVDRLQARIDFLEGQPAIKGDADYNKIQIQKYKETIDELQADIKADPSKEMPTTELSFYARYYNHDMIIAKREKFTGLIEDWYTKNPHIYEKGIKKQLPTDSASVRKRAEATVSKILGETDGNFEQSFAGYSSKHTRHRNLDIPNHIIWEFIEQNPISVMKNYTTRVAPEYHFKDTFGGKTINEMQEEIYNSVSKSDNVKKAQAAVRDFTAMYERVVTNVIKDPTALNQRIRQVLSDFAGMTYLGSAGFATLTDYAAIALQREAGAFLKLGFSVLDGQKISLNAREGRYAGELLDILKNMEGLRLVDDLSNRTIDRGLYSKVAGKAKTLFYSTNLLGPATNIAKRMESILRAHQIVEDSIAIYNGKATQQTKEMMAKMGFGAKEIKEIATKAPVERATDKGLYLANSDGWVKSGVSRETLDKFRYSMNAGIFNTVIMASPADKPIAMDGVFYVPWKVAQYIPGMKQDKAVRGYSRIENGLYSLPFAFMSYSFGAANKITASLAQNSLKNKAMGMTMAMGLAYMGLQLRYRNRPYVLDNMSTSDKIARTFDYSGLTAIYSDMFYRGLSIGTNLGYFENSLVNPKFISKDESERPMDAALEILGAPPSLVWEWKRGAVDFFNGDVNEGVKRFQQNLPFAKIWWMEGYMNDIGKVVGRW